MITKDLDIEIIKIIKTVIKRYMYACKYDFEDLYFEGVIEALKAIEDYDMTKEIKLTTYVFSRVKYRMIYLIRRERALKRDESKNINLEMMLTENNKDIYNLQIENNDLEKQIVTQHLKESFRHDLQELLTPAEYFYIELYLNGYSIRDIAYRTNANTKQISNKIYYIKKKLKKNKERFKSYYQVF